MLSWFLIMNQKYNATTIAISHMKVSPCESDMLILKTNVSLIEEKKKSLHLASCVFI